MIMTANRARSLSVALLLAASLHHGIFQNPTVSTGQETRGMLRLGRDLMRRTGSVAIDEQPVARAEFSSSAKGRSHPLS
jgi:hypothetical protein